MLEGMRPHVWQDFEPVLDVWSTQTTTPVLGAVASGAIALGRFLYLPEAALVFYQFMLFFSTVGNNGGAGNYLVKLPIPARRWMGGEYVLQSQIDDRVLGHGHASAGIGEIPQVPLMWIFGDRAGLTYGGRREDWAQAFCPAPKLYGTGNIPATDLSVAVTWPGGITLASAPQPSDINVVLTAVPTGNTGKVLYVTSVSTTGFTLNCETAPTAALNFAWKVEGSGTLLLGSNAPWNFGNGGDNIKGSLVYEADC